jgi:hypothetical protein
LYFFPDRTCGVFALLAFVLTPAVAQDRGQVGGKAIDRSTIARYEKLGAVYGGFVNDGFQAGREKAENNLPGFQFRQFPKAELPQVDVPFGLAFAVDSTVPDGGVRQLAGLKNLTVLSLYYAKVTSAGLKELAVLRNVAALNLGGTKITDDGLKGLAGLKNLSRLSLSSTPVSDAGIKELAALKSLTSLDLCRTQATDRGLHELTGLAGLAGLNLENTAEPRFHARDGGGPEGIVAPEKARPAEREQRSADGCKRAGAARNGHAARPHEGPGDRRRMPEVRGRHRLVEPELHAGDECGA